MSDDRHQELRLLVQADCDGELTPRDAAAVAAHLEGCAECRALQRALRHTKAQLRADATRHEAPDDFRRRMAATVAENMPKPAPARRLAWPWSAGSFGIGAALAAVLMLAILVPRGGGGGVEQSVIDGHLRALQSGHLYDVASTDRHTVKPWFDGKLDFAPPVKDLAAQGFPLRGGRLDTVDGRAVAALVYGRAKHVVDLYIWRRAETGGAGDAPPADAMRNGYNLVSWSQGEMRFWAVSDVNRQELDQFVREWREAP